MYTKRAPTIIVYIYSFFSDSARILHHTKVQTPIHTYIHTYKGS